MFLFMAPPFRLRRRAAPELRELISKRRIRAARPARCDKIPHQQRGLGGSLASIAETQDPLLSRACLRRLRRRLRSRFAEAGAKLFRGRPVVAPARSERRQAQTDLAPFGMPLRLQGGKILAEGSSELGEVTD